MWRKYRNSELGETPIRLVRWGNLAVLALVVAATLWLLNNSYREVLDKTALTAEGLAEEKAMTLLTQFEMLDLLLDRLSRKVRLVTVTGRPLDTLHEAFAAEAEVFPFVSGLLLLDRQARVLLASDQVDAFSGEVHLCAPFPHVFEDGAPDFIDSHDPGGEDGEGCRPLNGVYVSRPLPGKQGDPGYELVAVLEASAIGAGYFNDVTWALGERARYRIATADGRFLVGFRRLPEGVTYETVNTHGEVPHSLFHHVDMAGVRSEVPGFGLRVEVVYSHDDILAEQWRERAVLTMGSALAFAASWILLSGLILRLMRKYNADIRESAQRYNRSLSYAAIGAWEWDIASGELFWSSEVYRQFGLIEGEWTPTYERYMAAIHPDDRQMLQDAITASLEGDEEYDVTHRIIRPDGELRWIHGRGGVRRDARGTPLNMNGIVADVTEQYEAQRALAESESRFRTAYDSMSTGLVTISREGVVLQVNPAAEKMFGYDAAEMLGRNVSMLMPEDEASRHGDYLAGYRAGRHSAVFGVGRDLQGRRKSGELFPIRVSVGVMEMDGVPAFIGSITDQSDVRMLEEKLRHSQKMDAVGQLAGGVAHDFNNMLGIAIGGLDLLKTKLSGQVDDDKVMTLLDKVHDALWRGAKMTANLLDFSRQDKSGEAVVRLNELVTDSLDLIRKSLTSSVRVETELAPDLWSVLINPDDFRNAMVNLALNARDAMPQGGVIRLSSSNVTVASASDETQAALPPGNYVCFRVGDTGVGMPPEVAEKVFEPFFSTKDRGRGTGLGLSMVYSFVKRANGLIDVQSRPGQGSVFSIYLPRHSGAESEPVTDPALDRSGSGGIADGEVVLIVDDEEVLGDMAREMFVLLGFTPIVVNSGTEALRLLEQGDLDVKLLFSDIVMPDITGCSLALQAHRLRPQLPILLTSGYAKSVDLDELDTPDREWCEAMVMQCLPKPYELKTLRERLLALLS